MRNISLVDKIRRQRQTFETGASLDHVVEEDHSNPQRVEFEYWSEFFLAADDDISKIKAIRLPALLQNLGAHKPAHVTVHPPTAQNSAVVTVRCLPGRRPDPHSSSVSAD